MAILASGAFSKIEKPVSRVYHMERDERIDKALMRERRFMEAETAQIVQYPSEEAQAVLRRLSLRGRIEDDEILTTVREIIRQVRKNGDAAVLELTNRLDCPGAPIRRLRVSDAEIDAAYESISDELRSAMRLAAENIRRFHERQKASSWFVEEADGVVLGQYVRPHRRVGVLVPSASAPLFSSLMMAAVTAKAAGVEQVAAAAAPRRCGTLHPTILAAARVSGVDELYACGGAQAVAAMAYGIDSIPRVDKIVGAGNLYSQLAKKEVFGAVDVDKIAGPSEVLIIADETADPRYAAADLISQAEHLDDCSAVLATDSAELAQAVKTELARQTARLPRRKTIEAALKNWGVLFVVPSMDAAAELSDEIAPEHVEIHAANAHEIAGRLRHAGAVFIGEYTPEAVGDYAAGPNHILPTGGAARFSSSMTVFDFIKRSNFLSYTKTALRGMVKPVETLARAEGLEGHAAAMRVRFLDDLSEDV
ncbi:MAG: histidinol dehydrogenase [Candidatus Poribacteria bacterium]|nr:histidinol dehydrogenase [Candidatus Poribacteria bacterium]